MADLDIPSGDINVTQPSRPVGAMCRDWMRPLDMNTLPIRGNTWIWATTRMTDQSEPAFRQCCYPDYAHYADECVMWCRIPSAVRNYDQADVMLRSCLERTGAGMVGATMVGGGGVTMVGGGGATMIGSEGYTFWSGAASLRSSGVGVQSIVGVLGIMVVVVWVVGQDF